MAVQVFTIPMGCNRKSNFGINPGRFGRAEENCQ